MRRVWWWGLIGAGLGGAAFFALRGKLAAPPPSQPPEGEEDDEDDTKKRPADPAEWKMRPARFPSGVTYQQIVADNSRARGKVPAGFGPLKGTGASSKAAANAQNLLHSLPAGQGQAFEIDGVRFFAIKEWHSPHVPPIGPPHQWHHGVSVFEEK